MKYDTSWIALTDYTRLPEWSRICFRMLGQKENSWKCTRLHLQKDTERNIIQPYCFSEEKIKLRIRHYHALTETFSLLAVMQFLKFYFSQINVVKKWLLPWTVQQKNLFGHLLQDLNYFFLLRPAFTIYLA